MISWYASSLERVSKFEGKSAIADKKKLKKVTAEVKAFLYRMVKAGKSFVGEKFRVSFFDDSGKKIDAFTFRAFKGKRPNAVEKLQMAERMKKAEKKAKSKVASTSKKVASTAKKVATKKVASTAKKVMSTTKKVATTVKKVTEPVVASATA